MKCVLVVDDEEDMLWMLQRNLNKGMEDVEILAAKSGEEALAVLSDKKINLVITDINMPGMSGLDLLVEINNKFPNTGVVIMTAYPSSAYEKEAKKSGSLRFVEKPFDINEMRTIVEEIIHKDAGFQGTVEGVDLTDIVQFNGMTQATAALKVTNRDKEGMIFFKEGNVVHAICDNLTGENAFFTILNFNGGSLQNIRGVEAPTVTIDKGIEALLVEAAVKTDERTPPADHRVSYKSFAQDREQKDNELLEPSIQPPKDSGESTNSISGAEEASTFTEELEMTEIQKILAEFTDIEGVHTACLVGRDGFLLDNIARPGIDAEMIGAIASSGFGASESMGTQLSQGELKMTMFEFKNGPVIFAPVGLDAFLVIVADQETNLGWIRISIRKNSQRIKEAASL